MSCITSCHHFQLRSKYSPLFVATKTALYTVMSQFVNLQSFSSVESQTWSGPFTFVQAADTQLGLIERYIEKKENPGWSQEVELTRKLVQRVNQLHPKPKFLVICGDLVDAFDNQDRDPQVLDLKSILKDVTIPLICVCGNHDVGDEPTVESVNLYRKTWGPDYFRYYCGGVLFVVLNSQFYENRVHVKDMAEEQDAWLTDVLSDAEKQKPKHMVLFQHIPWFLKDAEEEDQYFNINKELRIQMLNKLYDAGIRYIFTGHYHQNAGGKFKDLELVVTSAVGAQIGHTEPLDKSGFRIVNVTEEAITHKYHEL